MNSIEKMRFTSENLCDILITLQENLAVFINRQRGRPWLPPQPLFYDGLFLPSSFPWGFPKQTAAQGQARLSSFLFLRNRPAALRLSVRDLDGEARAGPDEDAVCVAHGGVISGLLMTWFGGIRYDYLVRPGTGFAVAVTDGKPQRCRPIPED